MKDGGTDEVDAFRFWVGDRTERRSSVWKIWEFKKQIYASSRMTNGLAKLSIHGPHPTESYSEPYYCQYGYERRFREEHNLPRTLGGVPMFIRWRRQPASGSQAHFLARIQFSAEWLHLRQPAPDLKSKEFGVAIPPPGEGKISEIILVAAPRTHSLESLVVNGPATHLCHMPLGDAEVCLVLGRVIALRDGLFPSGISLRSPTALLPETLRQAELGKSIPDNNAVLVSHPNDYEAIRISEVSGVDVTVDRTDDVSR